MNIRVLSVNLHKSFFLSILFFSYVRLKSMVLTLFMKQIFRYRGKDYSQKDIDFINQLIQQNPNESRWALSKKLCQRWGWVQPNGALRDMVCRSFMLELDRSGLIQLPPKKGFPPNPLANRKKPIQCYVDQTTISSKLSQIIPLSIYQVRRTDKEQLCNSLRYSEKNNYPK